MLLVTSVFLVELLCVLVPCNPRYPIPDLSKDPHKLGYFESFKKFNKKVWTGFGHLQKSYLGLGPIEGAVAQESKEEVVRVAPIVDTFNGKLEGYFMKVVGGREVFAFEGIPYGEPPIGELRFRSPLPSKPWNGVRKVISEPHPCMQYNIQKGFRILGREDCLYLNVYSPQIPTEVYKPKLPVIVFVHGGGFFFGGNTVYGPSYLLQKDVIYCIMQYRLGILGFMSSGDSESSGNWGLKDQALAMKWINENIHNFGGDPNRVTIMGQSAGSALVHLHLLSRLSRPYFHNAISMSGTAFNYWALHTPEAARNYTQTLARNVGCPSFDASTAEMVHCLRNFNPALLLAQTPFFLDNWPYPSNAWRPCIETLEGNPDPFISDSPVNLYARKDVAKVPWIVTLVSGEGYEFLLFPYVTFQMKTLRKNWPNLAGDLADVDTLGDAVDVKYITKQLTKFYFQDFPPEKAPVANFANIVTDRMFVTGTIRAAQAHSQIAPTYSYIFDVNGQYNQIESLGYSRKTWGVGHAEDIFYVLNSTVSYHGFKREDPEFSVSQFMVNLYTNFAAKGEPLYTNPEGEDMQVWDPHEDPTRLQFLKIEVDKSFMIPDPYQKIVNFWDQLRIPDTPTEAEIIRPGYGFGNLVK